MIHIRIKISDRISSKIIVVGNILANVCMTSGKELKDSKHMKMEVL